ncbi:MAG: DUF4433 domain-containing protein [Roseicyclus sp.]|nr:DUF4433 domain-containing protein [Roseicyclus sp.]
MTRRFLFRMTYYRNLQAYLAAGYLFAKNHPRMQASFRISYDDIVARRGGTMFTTPCGSNINGFVPFYFSPITKMAYSIHKGNVSLKDPDGSNKGAASMDDVAYLVVDPDKLFASGRSFWFTDIACNSGIPPTYKNSPLDLKDHVDWSLFDEPPSIAQITEIGYHGVCKWQQDRDLPIEHQMRSKKRMAELLIRDYLRMDEVSCILLKNAAHEEEVRAWVETSGTEIPVYVKPGCYF